MNFTYALIIIGYLLLFGAVWMIKIFLNDLSDELKQHRGFFTGIYDIDHKYVKDLENFCREMAKEADATTANEKKIIEEYEALQEKITLLAAQHSKLLDTWQKIEEKYSATYEEFVLIRNDLEDMASDIANISDWCDEVDDDDLEWEPVDEETKQKVMNDIPEQMTMDESFAEVDDEEEDNNDDEKVEWSLDYQVDELNDIESDEEEPEE